MHAAERAAFWRIAGFAAAALEAGGPDFDARFTSAGWAVTTSTPVWAGNWFACHGGREASIAMLRELAARLIPRGATAVGWVSDPDLTPDQAGVRAVAEGTLPMMTRAGVPAERGWPGYAGATRRGRPEDVAAAFGVAAAAFQVDHGLLMPVFGDALAAPEAELHLAEHDGAIESMCIVHRAGATGYIYLMATDPAKRRRGAARAALVAAMDGAATRGVERFFLLASTAGEPLYRSLGYETIETSQFWVINPPA